MQKLKHYETLENVEKLIKEGEDRIQFTQNEHLLNLRTLHNDNLRALKEAKDEYQTKLAKMSKAHHAQLSNMESFAVEVAVKKYNFMLQDAYGLFNEEIKRVNGDHRQMQELITFYEEKIKTLVMTIVRLERMIVEINQYLH
jgi:hypothetical protein